ncbi:hypothetical protein [Nitrosomonas sp.]|uniref:hypothetical protein n=1 Tax=Nitrosomonas sp. TaxID=42353 RepID=UPI0025CEFCE7|nr:hypothetical protein [Nitrosomonas sp.]
MNRTDGGRTTASALNVQEIYLFLALPSGAYRYDAAVNELHLVVANDLRRLRATKISSMKHHWIWFMWPITRE